MRIPAPLCLRHQDSLLFRRFSSKGPTPSKKSTVSTTLPSDKNLGRTTLKQKPKRRADFKISDDLRVRFPRVSRRQIGPLIRKHEALPPFTKHEANSLIRKHITKRPPLIRKASFLSSSKHLTFSTIEVAKPSQSLRPALNRPPSGGIAYRTRRTDFDAKIKIRPYQTFQAAQPPLSKAYTFQDVLSIATNPRPETLLIDVREPHEIRLTGRIPTALNIPIVSSPESLFLSDEEFEERLGFPKPEQDKELVFYCKAGVRSRTAAGMAIDAGWTKVGEYGGSWMDWEKKGGAKEKDGGLTE